MRIKNIELNNFKFHKKLKFDINNRNCLIYGENGTGKSSIYWGLASVFKSKLIDDMNKYKNYTTDKDISIKIAMDDDSVLRLHEDNEKITNSFNTIYFLNQNFLEEIIKNDNLYEFFEKTLSLQFQSIGNIVSSINSFNEQINVDNHIEVIENRQSKTSEYDIFLNELKDKSNEIIQEYFQEENIILSFENYWGESNIYGNYEFSKPEIKLLINGKNDISINFNEAKLKLTALAVVLALIKIEEDLANQIKLLVLDDFLTSLDMANRKLIVKYILDNFGEYQKIILTHNIQFYNLIIRFLKLRREDDTQEGFDWDIKNIFIREYKDENLAKVIDKDENYLQKAQDELDRYELEKSGNFLRKEFERIATQFEQLLELGRVEDLDKILKSLSSLDYIFADAPRKILYDSFPEKMRRIKIILEPSPQGDESKLNQVRDEINSFETLVSLKKKTFDTTYLKSIILKTEFYKDILMNYASHDDREKELYQKEFKKAINLLKELNKILNDLK